MQSRLVEQQLRFILLDAAIFSLPTLFLFSFFLSDLGPVSPGAFFSLVPFPFEAILEPSLEQSAQPGKDPLRPRRPKFGTNPFSRALHQS
jgi:hypothetical protein